MRIRKNPRVRRELEEHENGSQRNLELEGNQTLKTTNASVKPENWITRSFQQGEPWEKHGKVSDL